MTFGVLIAVFLIASYLLSGLESAILSVSLARLRHLANEGDRAAQRLERIFRNRQHLLISILVLNSALNLGSFGLVAWSLSDRLGPWGYLLAIVIALPVLVLWVEILPKAHFRRAPLRLLLKHGLWVLVVIDLTIRPLVGILGWIFRKVFRREVINFSEQDPATTREAFRDLTALLERDGVLDADESTMIGGVLDFHRVKISEVMLAESGIVSVEAAMPISELKNLSRETSFTQFPVKTRPLAVIDVLPTLLLPPEALVGKEARHFKTEIVTARPEESAMEVVKRLRRADAQLASVIDESDALLGYVTIADMVKKMVAFHDE